MAKFRKKPVVVEAIPVIDIMLAIISNWDNLPDWVEEEHKKGNIVKTGNSIYVDTLEGHMIAEPSDMLIRGVKCEIYPCKPDIFMMTYEAVEG